MSNGQYNRTQHLGLPLYTDLTPMDLRDGYNESMRMIDRKTTQLETLIRERDDQTEKTVRTLLGDNTTDSASAAKSKWDKASTDAIDAMAGATAATEKANSNAAVLAALGADTTVHAAANKAKWDKAESDAIDAMAGATAATEKANSNAAVLAALGADTTVHAAANKAKWDKAESDADTANNAIARILKILSRTNGHLVTFGDSYGTNVDKAREWPSVLNARLGEGSTLHNYCIAGAGYTAPNTTFRSELDNAKADTSYNHNEVGLVVIAGSRNTNDGYSGALRTAAVSLYEGVKQEFPNARIIVVPMLWDWAPVSNYWRFNAASCISAAREVGVEAVPWAWTWNLGNNTYFPTNNIHPTADGTNVIVSYMLDYINHNYTGRTESFSWRDSTGVQALFTVNASGGLITFGWYLASDVTPANFTRIENVLPKWAQRNSDVTNEPKVWSLMASNGANEATMFKISPSDDNLSGTFGIQPFVTTGSHGSPNGLMSGGITVAW